MFTNDLQVKSSKYVKGFNIKRLKWLPLIILALVIIFLFDGDQVFADELTSDVIFIQKLLIIHREKK